MTGRGEWQWYNRPKFDLCESNLHTFAVNLDLNGIIERKKGENNHKSSTELIRSNVLVYVYQ
jgi:hypothetical protein